MSCLKITSRSALRDVDRRLRDGLETRRNVAPRLDQVVVEHRTHGQRFAQQVGHVGVRRHVAVGAESLDVEVALLDGLIDDREEAAFARLVELVRGVGRRVEVREVRLFVALRGVGVRRVVPLDVGIESVVGVEAVAVRTVDGEVLVDTHHGVVGQRDVRIDRRGFERRGRFGRQRILQRRAGGLRQHRRAECGRPDQKKNYLFHHVVILDGGVRTKG